MHAVLVNFLPAPAELDAAAIFARWPSLADIAEAIASGGTRVSVVQMAGFDGRVTRSGIGYHFVDSRGMRGAGDLGRSAASIAAELGADIVHVHSLAFARHAAALARCLPMLPVVLQDHADGLPSRWRHLPWRRWYGAAAGIAFTSLDQATPFTRRRLFGRHTRLLAIPESSSRFTPGDRRQARMVTGLHGDPCVLSVGHLTVGKDPLTMLDGIAKASERLPGLQLWCAYGTAPLLSAVRRRIEGDARLAGRVHLLGAVPHADIESLMRSADLFVSASLAEGSGYALLEAMACGLRPVVTDIPSFRAITGDGRIGRLWPRGDAAALAEALVAASSDVAASDASREEVRDHFNAALSFDALGRRWAEAYRQVAGGKGAA
jgi:glycosyltransferase involved in cell wall biosynthesis